MNAATLMKSKPFNYPKARRRAPDLASAGRPRPEGRGEKPMGLIQGQAPGSREEWRVAKALWRLKVDFRYQVPVNGGRNVRGGYVLDFLVLNPFPIPVPVDGEYWHAGQRAESDKLRDIILFKIYGVPPRILWGKDLETDDEALAAVRRILNR